MTRSARQTTTVDYNAGAAVVGIFASSIRGLRGTAGSFGGENADTAVCESPRLKVHKASCSTTTMPRIPEKNPRYRTKQQIAEDVAFVLKSPLSYGTKFAVLKDACWVWTEFDGKYEGCRYWTKMAMLARAADKKAKLIHEHVVPKKVVINILMDLREPTSEEVYSILDRFLTGVVVTPEEDGLLNCDHRASMPPEFFDPDSPQYQDAWLRYAPFKEHGIEIVCRADS